MSSKHLLCAVMLYVLFFCSGYRMFEEMYNPPKKAKTSPKKVDKSPATYPDGTPVGLSDYERSYIKSINSDFEKQREVNKKRVFGG